MTRYFLVLLRVQPRCSWGSLLQCYEFVCDVHCSRTGAFSNGVCPVFCVLGRSTWNDSMMMHGTRNMLTSSQATFSFIYMDFVFKCYFTYFIGKHCSWEIAPFWTAACCITVVNEIGGGGVSFSSLNLLH